MRYVSARCPVKTKLFFSNGTVKAAEGVGNLIVTSNDGTPIALIGEDPASGGVWILLAGDTNFDTYLKSIDSSLRPVTGVEDLTSKFS